MKFKPRFSLRTMLILVAFVCAFFAFWRATTIAGVRDVGMRFSGQYYKAVPRFPFLLTAIELHEADRSSISKALSASGPTIQTHFLVWFYGWIVELPFTTTRMMRQGEPLPVKPWSI